MITLPIQGIDKRKILLIGLILVGLVGGKFSFSLSYFSNLNVVIGVCLLPFTFFIIGEKRNNLFYATAMMLFGGLAMTYHIRISFFFALGFYFLWLIEFFIGRVSLLILFLLLFMSPFFIQVITILGFPIRLMLSSYAGALLNFAGVDVQVQGNMMLIDKMNFSVDEACMGLSMLIISLLMGVFVLAHRYRTSGTTLNLLPTIIFFSVAFLLNLIANLIRIVALVFFRIPSENPIHEAIGILCLIAYVVVPLHSLGKWIVYRYGQPTNNSPSALTLNLFKTLSLIILPLTILYTGTSLKNNFHSATAKHAEIKYSKGEAEQLKDGISKISTNELLIYVKTIPEFFTGEHTPLMCWKGSGYEFTGITATTVEGNTIYKGTLVKNNKSLYTAWWYSNGHVDTISQLDWRMRMLKGEPKFCLINVTAEDEQTLMSSIESMFASNELAIKGEI